jgi:hypothetical protein
MRFGSAALSISTAAIRDLLTRIAGLAGCAVKGL